MAVPWGPRQCSSSRAHQWDLVHIKCVIQRGILQRLSGPWPCLWPHPWAGGRSQTLHNRHRFHRRLRSLMKGTVLPPQNSQVLSTLGGNTEADREEEAWPGDTASEVPGDARREDIPLPAPRPLQTRDSQQLRAGLCVIHQDLELGAHVEVAPVDGDPGAPCFGAHGGLQGVDQGQLWANRRVVRPQASPGRAWRGWGAGCIPLPRRRSAPETCPPWRRSPSPRLRTPLGLGLWRTRSWVGEASLVKEQPAGGARGPGRRPLASPLNDAPLHSQDM